MVRHIGLEDAGKRPYGYRQRPGLVIIHVTQSVDSMPPYLWRYLGERETSKAQIRQRVQKNPKEILAQINADYKTNFTAVIVA